MNDIMIDIESWGNSASKPCIVQFAAVEFCRFTGAQGKSISFNVDARAMVEFGAEIEADTIYWWMSQKDEAIKSLLSLAVPPLEAFYLLNDFLSDCENIWSHATYDFVRIESAFKMLKMPINFSHRDCRDIRTLTFLAGVNPKDYPIECLHHNALDDCKHQIKYVVDALAILEKKK